MVKSSVSQLRNNPKWSILRGVKKKTKNKNKTKLTINRKETFSPFPEAKIVFIRSRIRCEGNRENVAFIYFLPLNIEV